MEVALMAVAAVAGMVILGLRRLAHRLQPPDTVIDTLIGSPKVRYEGHDDALRVATAQRRERADVIKRGARQIETKDDRGFRLRKAM